MDTLFGDYIGSDLIDPFAKSFQDGCPTSTVLPPPVGLGVVFFFSSYFCSKKLLYLIIFLNGP